MRSLYLTYEQSLRLKKLLSRLEQAIGDIVSKQLNFHLARAGLFELSSELSPLSRSRKLIEEILDATKDLTGAAQNSVKVSSLSAELTEIYLE